QSEEKRTLKIPRRTLIWDGGTIDYISELALPEIKGSLDADEDIGVDEVSSAIDNVFEVVVGGGEFSKNKNRVISVLKDGGGEFDDSLDEINLGLNEEFVIRVLEGRDVSSESFVVFLKWVYHEKSREVFSVTPWAAKGGRKVLCYVQGNTRRKRKKSVGCGNERRECTLFGASVFVLFNPGPDCFAHSKPRPLLLMVNPEVVLVAVIMGAVLHIVLLCLSSI
ncbi:hypothetical protein Tco_1158381, partial [Tanacetum coccineum]